MSYATQNHLVFLYGRVIGQRFGNGPIELFDEPSRVETVTEDRLSEQTTKQVERKDA